MSLIVVKNKIIPPSGVKAMAFWPWLFVRAKYMSERDMRHENIHGRQQVEMLVVGVILAVVLWLCGCGWWSLLALGLYYWVYIGFYLAGKLLGTDRRDGLSAYRWNPFEREAYMFEGDADYLNRRKLFAWYLFLYLF